MSLLIPYKLSNLDIDIDKDWDTKKIENLGAPDTGDDAKRHDSAPEAHEDTHVSGGLDDIDSALDIAAMANLATGKMWQGNANRPVEVDPPAVPSGLIAMWHGTIATIPAGWLICDGGNGTPNLLAKFVEGVATAATNPGATGGSTAKTTAGHRHDKQAAGVEEWQPGGDTITTETDSIADIRPLFYDIAFIMKT